MNKQVREEGRELVQFYISDVAKSIRPDWEFPWDWLFWPPDLFGLTSLILKRTGCYRYALLEECYLLPGESDINRRGHWQTALENSAEQWLTALNQILAEEHSEQTPEELGSRITERNSCLGSALEVIGRLAGEVTIDALRVVEQAKSEAERQQMEQLCGALIRLHCIADEACTGLGLLTAPKPGRELVHCLGNLLLNARGSLSTIPKHHAVVLPKLRTPQSGLTLRSLSHHVTCHSSEVEVFWRAMPWPNVEENTLNILCVPWPIAVDERSFHAHEDRFQAVRYFRYEPPDGRNQPHGDTGDDPIDLVVRKIEHLSRRVARVHMVVFPEVALSIAEYVALMEKLRASHRENRLPHVPMIIAGVRNEVSPLDGTEQDASTGGPSSNADDGAVPRSLNEVRLAAYFTGRWYELSQRKHHRWKLDRSQIRQYGLEGKLATTRNWFEHIPLAQRRLTFLAPTGWLALCPLICEDLAQLEPVSELIRGVGPTLLVALLFDGPQLTNRWSARYASVLADDPGTAVLSLTSLGMAVRSRRPDETRPDEAPRRTVALWKDQIIKWKEIDIDGKHDAFLLTISADWTEEYTVDGRSDHQNASVFKFEGVRPVSLAEVSEPPAPAAEVDPGASTPPEVPNWRAEWADIRELSALTFALDAGIQLRGQHIDLILQWLLGEPTSRSPESMPKQLDRVVSLLYYAQKDPAVVGVVARHSEWPTPSLRRGAVQISRLLGKFTGSETALADYWTALADEAERLMQSGTGDESDGAAILSDDEETRVRYAIAIAILSALHSRVEKLRRKRPFDHGSSNPDMHRYPRGAEAARIMRRVEQALRQAPRL